MEEVMEIEEIDTNSPKENSLDIQKNGELDDTCEKSAKSITNSSDSVDENEDSSDLKNTKDETDPSKDASCSNKTVVEVEVHNSHDAKDTETNSHETDSADVNSHNSDGVEKSPKGNNDSSVTEASENAVEKENESEPKESKNSESNDANDSESLKKDANDSESLKKDANDSESLKKESTVEKTDASPDDISNDIVILNGAEKSDDANKENKKEEAASKDAEKEENENVFKDIKAKESENQDASEGTKKKEEKKKKGKTCVECGKKRKIEFRIHFQGKVHALCSEPCYKQFKEKQSAPKPPPEPPKEEPVEDAFCPECKKLIFPNQGYYPVVGDVKPLCSEDCVRKYQENNSPPRKCSQCDTKVEDKSAHLSWETMVFCADDCLQKYQSFLGSHCTCCQAPVQQASLGKYCVCFGSDIRQFCSGSCLDDFKKGLKVCTFCQTDLSAGSEGFLAPVGDKGQFKDFCSQACMERYETMNNLSKNAPESQECAHCNKQGTFKIQVSHNEKKYFLCCDNCVAGLRCSLKKTDNVCSSCHSFFRCSSDLNSNKEIDFKLKLDGLYKFFCSKTCMTTYVLSHRRITQCLFCKVKKYNFDMIEKTDRSVVGPQIFCSLNCMSLHRANSNATTTKSVRCDNCSKTSAAQYHLTMSDSSIRNFCSYNCVLTFQNQFTSVPALTTTSMTRQLTTPVQTLKTTPAVSSPVIANVVSLAQARTGTTTLSKPLVPQTLVSVRPSRQPVAVFSTKPQITTSTAISPSLVGQPQAGQMMREVIVQPPAPKSVKNKTVWCKPIMQTKGVNAKTPACHKAVQTDEHPRPIIFPVPIPVYVPTPLHMFSRPVPCPVPFPVPIPVPILIPSSKDANSQVMRHFKKIQENSHEASKLIRKSFDDSNKSSDMEKPSDEGSNEDQTIDEECENGAESESMFSTNETRSTKRALSPVKNSQHKRAKLDSESPFDESRDTLATANDESSNPSLSTSLPTDSLLPDPSSFQQESSPTEPITHFETPSFSFDDEEQPMLKVP